MAARSTSRGWEDDSGRHPRHHGWVALLDAGAAREREALRGGHAATTGPLVPDADRAAVALAPGPPRAHQAGVVALIAGVIAFNITAWLLPQLDINELGGGLIAVRLHLRAQPAGPAGDPGLVASRSVVALVILTLLFQAVVICCSARSCPPVRLNGGIPSPRSSSRSCSASSPAPSACCSGWARTTRTTARSCGRWPAAGRTSSAPTSRASSSSSSTGCPTTCCRTRCAPVACPTMASWIRSGTHKLGHWDALLPSTTPASQAGILHGNNDGIPNFRWWEKKNGRLLVANHPEDATEIERRVSQRRGAAQPRRREHQQHLHGRRRPRVPGDVHHQGQGARPGRERRLRVVLREPLQLHHDDRQVTSPRSSRRTSSRGARCAPASSPRHAPRLPVPVGARAPPTSRCGRWARRSSSRRCSAARPVIYMDYTDYDEIAHHSGPERPESLDALDGVDRELRTLRKAAAGRAPAVPLRDPRRPRPEPGRDLPAALRRDPPGRRPLADGRQGVGRRGDRADRGLGPAQHVPGRGLADQGRHRIAGARRDARAARRTARSDMGPTRRRGHARGRSADAGRRQPRRQPATDGQGRGGARGPHRGRRRQPGAHLLQRQQGAHDARGDRGALSGPGRGARQPPGHRRRSWCARPTAACVAVGKNGIHFLDEDRVEGEDPLARLRRARRRRRSGAWTPSSTWATSRSSASTTPRPARSPRSRSSSAPMAAWAAPRRARSCSIPPTGSWTWRRSSARRWSTSSCARWMERELGMTFGPQGATPPAEAGSGAQAASATQAAGEAATAEAPPTT